MLEVAVIVNPVSGGGKAVRNLPEIEKSFRMLGFEPHIFQTKYQGHASKLALSFSGQPGLHAVVAAGGDGTVNEVASGLIGSQMSLGIIPLGSGNGLGRQLGISKNILQACEVIAKGSTTLIDSGELNGRPFFVTSGIGFDGLVASHFADSKRRGFAAYMRSAVQLLSTWQPFMAEVAWDGPDGSGKNSGLFSVIVAANAEQYGNNAYIAPGALLDDGMVNLTTIGPVNMLQAGLVGAGLFNKTIAAHPLVQSRPATKCYIAVEKPQFFHLDGEPCGMQTSFNVEVRKHSLKVLTSMHEAH